MSVKSDLVLGGAGFVGSHLSQHLLSMGREVTVVARSALAALPRARNVTLDLYGCSDRELAEMLDSADIIYHLAWSNLPASAEADIAGDLQANVGFVARLLSLMRGSGKTLVFCSSGGTVYGVSPDEAIDEGHPLRPINAYGAAKVAAEVYCGLFYDAYGVDVRIARLANPFGPGQSFEKLQGAASRFIRSAVEGKPIEIWGDGHVVRDYIDIRDAVAGLFALATADLQSDQPRIFNIGTGIGTDLNQLVALVEKVADRSVDVRYLPGRRIDVPRNVLSVGRAKRHLNWSPQLRMADGVAHMIKSMNVAHPDSAGGTSD